MEEVRVQCVHGNGDTLSVRAPISRYGNSIVTFEIKNEVWLTADDARKVRDALNAALDEHEAELAKAKEKRKSAKFTDEDGDSLWVHGMNPEGALLRCTSKDGFYAEGATLDAIIEKLQAIRATDNVIKEDQ